MLNHVLLVQLLLNSLCTCLLSFFSFLVLCLLIPFFLFYPILDLLNFFPVTFVLFIFHLNPLAIHKQLKYCLYTYRIYQMTIFLIFNSWMLISNNCKITELNNIIIYFSLLNSVNNLFCFWLTTSMMLLIMCLVMFYF